MNNMSILETLSMADIKKYFENHGWKLNNLDSSRNSAKSSDGTEFTFIFKDSDDTSSKKFAVEFLSRYYELDFSQLANEISSSSFDIVKLIKSSTQFPGIMPLGDFTEMNVCFKDALRYSLCSEISDSPRAIYTKTPKSIDTFLNSIQMLQSESGSYVTNILIPNGKPRQALKRIALGLGNLQRAISVSDLAEDGFISGLNANAAQKLSELGSNFGNIELKIRWNHMDIPSEINTVESVFSLTSDLSRRLQHYSNSIAKKSPILDLTFVGQIDEIKKIDSVGGKDERTRTRIAIRATRVGDHSDAPNNVNRLIAFLGPEFHDLAFDSAKNNYPIYIKGDIIKSGKTWTFTDVKTLEKTPI